MRQILQSLRDGSIEVADVPCPQVRPGHLLVQSSRSLISAGTERMLVEFGRAGLLAKARAQPEKVKQVLQKIRTDGLLPTLETVFRRLDEPLPLGYCNAGRVLEIGPGVNDFRVGDRVASNGPHAEIVCVPATLLARVPPAVSDEAAAFTVLGAVPLHGIRLLQPTLGERFVVIGLGLVGLLAVQLLQAHGCRVLGIDPDPERCRLAGSLGAEVLAPDSAADPVRAALSFAGAGGVDGVLVAASTTSDEVIHQAAEMCRKRGRIVLVGVVGLDLQRRDFYEKELTFQVSCSYGPGRYDTDYEAGTHDYPLPYVRWTVARNFEAVLDSIAAGRLRVEPLISHRLPITRAGEAYGTLVDDRSALGVVIEYPEGASLARSVDLPALANAAQGATRNGVPTLGVIGAGAFARGVLLPAIARAGARIHSVASAGGVTSVHAGRKFGALHATTDVQSMLAAPEVDAVVIATRHDSHADLTCAALRAGKHVFVEKPMAIDAGQLGRVVAACHERPDRLLMVGFNRRFAPHAVKVRDLLALRRDPVAISAMINAGELPADHWASDDAVGGGRIVGEACHFIDLLLFWVGAAIVSVHARRLGSPSGSGGGSGGDGATIDLAFADGSIGTIHYWTNGPKSFPKERYEVFCGGRALVLHNWRKLESFGWSGVPRMRMAQDKGHRAEIAGFLQAVAGDRASLVALDDLVLVSRATFAARDSVATGGVVDLAAEGHARR